MANLLIKKYNSVPSTLKHRSFVAVGSDDDYSMYMGNEYGVPVRLNQDKSLEHKTLLPTTELSKSGQMFLYNKNTWVYDENGKPMPINGYGEIIASLTINSSDNTVCNIQVVKDDFKLLDTIPAITRQATGYFSTGTFDIGSKASHLQQNTLPFLYSTDQNIQAVSDGVENTSGNNVSFDIYILDDGVLSDITSGEVKITFKQTIYS